MEAEESPPARRRPGPRGPDPELVARAARLRAEGKSDRAIAAELGVGYKSVGRWLEGMEPRNGADGKFKPRDDVDTAEVARLREQLVERRRSWDEVGAELGVSGETARRRYKQAEALPVNDLERQGLEDNPGPEVTK
jgi:Homeodomain-like domain